MQWVSSATSDFCYQVKDDAGGDKISKEVTFVMFYEAHISLEVDLLKTVMREEAEMGKHMSMTAVSKQTTFDHAVICSNSAPAPRHAGAVLRAVVRGSWLAISQVCCSLLRINKVGLFISDTVSHWKNCAVSGPEVVSSLVLQENFPSLVDVVNIYDEEFHGSS